MSSTKPVRKPGGLTKKKKYLIPNSWINSWFEDQINHQQKYWSNPYKNQEIWVSFSNYFDEGHFCTVSRILTVVWNLKILSFKSSLKIKRCDQGLRLAFVEKCTPGPAL